VGRQRLLLRLPLLVSHRITEDSPLRAWRSGMAALAADASSEIVVVVEAVHYASSRPALRQHTYHVHPDVRQGHRRAPRFRRALNSAPRAPACVPRPPAPAGLHGLPTAEACPLHAKALVERFRAPEGGPPALCCAHQHQHDSSLAPYPQRRHARAEKTLVPLLAAPTLATPCQSARGARSRPRRARRFAPIVSRPHGHGAPRIAWASFHDTVPAPGGSGAPAGPAGRPPRSASASLGSLGAAAPAQRRGSGALGWAPRPAAASGHGTPRGSDASPPAGGRTPADAGSPPTQPPPPAAAFGSVQTSVSSTALRARLVESAQPGAEGAAPGAMSKLQALFRA